MTLTGLSCSRSPSPPPSTPVSLDDEDLASKDPGKSPRKIPRSATKKMVNVFFPRKSGRRNKEYACDVNLEDLVVDLQDQFDEDRYHGGVGRTMDGLDDGDGTARGNSGPKIREYVRKHRSGRAYPALSVGPQSQRKRKERPAPKPRPAPSVGAPKLNYGRTVAPHGAKPSQVDLDLDDSEVDERDEVPPRKRARFDDAGPSPAPPLPPSAFIPPRPALSASPRLVIPSALPGLSREPLPSLSGASSPSSAAAYSPRSPSRAEASSPPSPSAAGASLPSSSAGLSSPWVSSRELQWEAPSPAASWPDLPPLSQPWPDLSSPAVSSPGPPSPTASSPAAMVSSQAVPSPTRSSSPAPSSPLPSQMASEPASPASDSSHWWKTLFNVYDKVKGSKDVQNVIHKASETQFMLFYPPMKTSTPATWSLPRPRDIQNIWDEAVSRDEDEDMDDMDGFIDDDDDEEDGVGIVDEDRWERRQMERRRIEKERVKALGLRPGLMGIDTNAWDGNREVFGGGRDYDWALGDEDEELYDD
ncbi:hypothetical protein OF83DRAFT_1172790 [Amylostereum chailletii]|nr:hypothetical protein OF83DRAFT_1172790 [Amylostereum chailletii]